MTTAFPSQRLKIRFLPAVPGTNAAGAAAAAAFSAQIAQDAANTAVQATLTKVDKAGDTMSGALILSGDPTSANGAATKNYADGKVAKTGDSMSGFLSLNADPTATLHAATKNYADTKVALTGGTMTGLLTLSGAPINPLHAATKLYVDNAVVSGGGSVFQPLDSDLTSIAAASLTGRMYFRRGAGDWAPVIVGAGLVFDPVTGDFSSTAPPSGGNVNSSDTPTLNQLALWLGTTTIKGINIGTGLQLQTAGSVQTLVATALPVTDGDKGDVTVSGSGATWTIDPDSVTYAKMQNVSVASVLLGRGSAAGAGDPQEITLGTGLSMTGTQLAATGSINVTPTPTAGQTAKWTNSTTLKGANVYTTAATAPVTPDVGDFWYDTSTGTLAVNVDDGNTQQWLAVAPGAGNIASNSAFVTLRTFTTTSTYVPTPGTQFAIVEVVGGGGAGGGCTSSAASWFSGAGGGSGGYSRSVLTAAQIGSSQTVTIGAGGTPTTGSGGAGGDTSLGSLVIAKGGGGGIQASAPGGIVPSGGIGGSTTGAVGDITAAGAPGVGGLYGGVNTLANSSTGGSSIFGGGAQSPSSAQVQGPGLAASNYGSGGSGSTSSDAVARAGGAGSAGIVIITEYNIGVGQQGPQGLAGGVTTPLTPQGRLTLQAATPVMTTTQAAKTTLFYSPYCGNQVAIFNGTTWATTSFNELSAVTTDTTKSPAAIGVSKVNDWFVWNDAGTLRLSHGPDWSNDTTRAATLTRQNGIWVNTAAITNGPGATLGTYVGTTRSNASSQLDWIYPVAGAPPTAGVFNVWNGYNRVDVSGTVQDTTSTWTLASLAFKEFRNDTTFEIRFVIGLQEDAVTMHLNVMGLTNGSGYQQIGAIGVDSTTTVSGARAYTANTAGAQSQGSTHYAASFLGYHFVAGLESSADNAQTVTAYGIGTSLMLKMRM